MKREKLPDERDGVTKEIRLLYAEDGKPAELVIYAHVGQYPDGRPGEIFLRADKEGSTVSGLLDALAITLSIGLQHGVPLDTYVEKLVNLRFTPEGRTTDPGMPSVASMIDAVARWLRAKYVTAEEEAKIHAL